MNNQEQILDYSAEIIRMCEDEAEKFANPEKGSSGIDDHFIKSCLFNNERGDGYLYAAMQDGKFIQVRSWGKEGQWLEWTGHHWKTDELDHARNAVDEVAQKYLASGEIGRLTDLLAAEAAKVEPDKEALKKIKAEISLYYSRAQRLRKKTGAENCLDWAAKIGKDSLAILGEDVDTMPTLLACKNGVLDLRTGLLSPGRPEDYLLRAVPVEWTGIDTPCPTWEAFISEIHQGDQEIIDFMQTLFGYAITGLTTEHFIALFLGDGRNGKGTMFETFRALLGDLAWTVSPELLIEQKNSRSSAGPSPDLMSLFGRRMVIASESDDNRRISGQQVKRLTGADTITARAPHDRAETNIRPTWKLFFYTNHVPKGMAADFALKNRLVYLQYPLKFVTNPDPSDPNQRLANKQLPADLLKELSGILAWGVRGTLKFFNQGKLIPPDKIFQAVEDLQRSEDTFRRFWEEAIKEKTIVLDAIAKSRFADIYSAYAAWYADSVSDSDKYRITKIAVTKWLEKAGFKKEKTGGNVYILGAIITIGVLP